MLDQEMQVEIPSPETVLRLARKHLRRYQAIRWKALQGEPGYRLQEANDYLWLWRGAVLKSGRWEILSLDQRREVLDALEAGE